MPHTYIHLLVVQGRGIFPIDMLRYDKLTPYTERDSTEIAASLTTHIDGYALRTITLQRTCDNKRWRPTEGRWHSFLWSVLAHDTRRNS